MSYEIYDVTELSERDRMRFEIIVSVENPSKTYFPLRGRHGEDQGDRTEDERQNKREVH